MPIKQYRFYYSNQSGQSSARDLLIVVAIVLAVAALVMVAFIFLRNKNTALPDKNGYLEQIKKQLPATGSAGTTGESRESADVTGAGTTSLVPQEEIRSFQAVLTGIAADSLTLMEKGGNKQITVYLEPTTNIIYNNEKFERSRFYIGDQLEATVVKRAGNWQAREIKVIVSANPATPAPVPKTPNVQPDGSIKPL
jgi:hypothetical protein